MVDMRAQMSAYVESGHPQAVFLVFVPRQAFSVSQNFRAAPRLLCLIVSGYRHILEVCKHTVHCYTCGWAEAELDPLQKPFV